MPRSSLILTVWRQIRGAIRGLHLRRCGAAKTSRVWRCCPSMRLRTSSAVPATPPSLSHACGSVSHFRSSRLSGLRPARDPAVRERRGSFGRSHRKVGVTFREWPDVGDVFRRYLFPCNLIVACLPRSPHLGLRGAVGLPTRAPIDGWRGNGRRHDRFPVKGQVRVLRLEGTARSLVERGSANLHAGRRSKPIQKARRRPAAMGGDVDKVGMLVAAPIACKSDDRQRLLSFLGARRFRRSRTLAPWGGLRANWALGGYGLPRAGARRPRRGPTRFRGALARTLNEGKPDVLPDAVIAPDFSDRDLVVLAQASRDVDHRGRHVQMEGPTKLCEARPLGERLEVVDRFPGLDLDDRLQSPAARLGQQDQVRIQDHGPTLHGRILFRSRIHAGFVATPALRLKQPNNTVVLELLSHRPHQDRAHLRLHRTQRTRQKTPKSSTGRSLRPVSPDRFSYNSAW